MSRDSLSLVRNLGFFFSFLAASASGQNTDHAAALDAVRQYALTFTNSLPDYTCTQTTHQITSLGQPAKILSSTVVEEQLSLVEGKEVRTITRIDGQPASAEGRPLPAGVSRGEFGNLLALIFDPAANATLRWDRAATLNKRSVDVFSFRVPQKPGYTLSSPKGTAQVPFEGVVYADAQTHAVLRIQMKCTNIPANSEYQALDLTLDYKPAQVAGKEFILPSHYELNLRTPAYNASSAADYTAYHRFSTDAAIDFGGDTR